MRPFNVLLAVAILTSSIAHQASTVQAQTLQTASSSETGNAPLWEIHLNLQKTFASPLGQWGLKMIEQEHPEAIGHIVKFAEAIGLDPRTDVGEVAIFGDGFGETDHTVVANIGPSTGNLEGWMLAAPGYKSEDLDDNTLLHSVNVEKHDARAWLALPKHASSGNYVLVGSLDRQRTVKLAREVLSGNAAPIANPLEGDSLLKFFVSDLSAVPMDIDDDEPGSAIVKTVQQFGLNVASDSDNLRVNVEITASSAGKARQISQLLTGLKALVQLVDDYEVQKASELLDNMVVQHTEGQAKVQASMTTSYQALEKLAHDIEHK